MVHLIEMLHREVEICKLYIQKQYIYLLYMCIPKILRQTTQVIPIRIKDTIFIKVHNGTEGDGS